MRSAFLRYVLLLYAICGSVRAQEHYFIRHPAFTNLPSIECYNIMQCKKGYIWVGTAKGLFWYNADSVFAAKNPRGKSFESCYWVKQFDQTGMLVLANDNYLYHCKYQSKYCDSLPFSSVLANYVAKYSYAFNLVNINTHQWIVNTQYSTYKLNSLKGDVSEVANPDTLDDFCFVIEKNRCFQIKKYFSKHRQMTLMHGDSMRICVRRNGTDFKLRFRIGNNNFPNWRSFCELTSTGDIVFSLSNVLLKITKENKISSYNLPDDVLCVYIDRENDLWAGTLKGGVHYFKQGDLSKAPMNSLRGISVTGVCFDYERNVWCSTLDKGIFISRSKENYYYPNVPELNSSLFMQRQIGNCLYFSGTAGKIIRIKDKVAREYNLKGVSSFVRDIIDYHNGFILIADKVYETDSLFNVVRAFEQDKEYPSLPMNLFYYNKDSVLGLSKNTLGLFDKQKIKIIWKTDDLLQYQLISNQMQMFAGASKNNFYRIRRNNELAPMLSRPLKIVRAAVALDTAVWFFNTDDSLFFLKNGLLINMSEKYNVYVTDLADIKVDYNGSVWLSGNGILMSIQFGMKKIGIKRYKASDGIKSMNIRRLALFNEEVLLNTDEGLFIMPKEIDGTIIRPEFHLHSVATKGKVLSTTGNYLELGYKDNSLQLYFDVLTFSEPGKPPHLLYRILEYDTNWRRTNAPVVELYNLEAGKHTVQIKAVNNNGFTSKTSFEFVVKIAPPFWKTVWFIILIVLFISSSVFYVVRQIVIKVRKREREKAEINARLTNYQMSALQAQMNPHFLFNVISGIQRYILKKDKQEAYDYLAKFSKLIRMVLYNSQKSEVTLASELDIINLYVEMEHLRFDSNFEFEMRLDGKLDLEDVLIPVMLLQPYIENAIWHGLMNLGGERKGRLTMDIERIDNSLKVTIKDNGVGRERAKRYKMDAGHRSMGMSITENRLKLLNELSEDSITDVKIVDLKDNGGNAVGTMVIINVSIHER